MTPRNDSASSVTGSHPDSRLFGQVTSRTQQPTLRPAPAAGKGSDQPRPQPDEINP